MHELRYERPTTLSEAVACLRVDGARALAGGTDIIPQLREGRRTVSRIVDLKHVPELNTAARLDDGCWRIGAALSVGRLGRNQAFAQEQAALLEAACLIGSLQVQNRASLGGNLCNAAPSADAVPMLIALDAVAVVTGIGGERWMPVEAVPIGPGRTALGPGDVLCAIELPTPAARTAGKYLRFTPRREMDIAIAGAAVRLDLAMDGSISVARVVLASVGPTPLRAASAETMLTGATPSAALFAAAGAKAAEDARPISDTRGSAAYRRDLVAVLTKRALADCASRLGVPSP